MTGSATVAHRLRESSAPVTRGLRDGSPPTTHRLRRFYEECGQVPRYSAMVRLGRGIGQRNCS